MAPSRGQDADARGRVTQEQCWEAASVLTQEFFFKIYLFCFCLHWVFVALFRLSLIAVHGG